MGSDVTIAPVAPSGETHYSGRTRIAPAVMLRSVEVRHNEDR